MCRRCYEFPVVCSENQSVAPFEIGTIRIFNFRGLKKIYPIIFVPIPSDETFLDFILYCHNFTEDPVSGIGLCKTDCENKVG